MTKEELCIRACKYAIGELARKGSTGFITSSHEGGQQITWVEVMEWLSREQCKDAISREDAINALKNLDDLNGENVFTKNGLYPWNILKELPSVQPKYSTSEWCHDCKEYNKDKHCCTRFNNVIRKTVEEMKQSKTGHCKDCKYFEYDHFENMGGIPLITAHKVCKRHGLICKTDEDGYCYLWEHKAESEVHDADSN